MAGFCSACGAAMPDGTVVCPACGKGKDSVAAPATPGGTTGGMTDNVAGLLAYITFIPAIIFLVMEPYNKNRFIRFHSFQCLFFWGALFVLGIALTILSLVPFVGLILLPLEFVIWVGALVVWIILLLKALQGQMYKLPIIGDMAEKQANAL